MRAHFDKWGWVAFLRFVSEKAVIFYKNNGQTNLSNIKETKLYDVLLWASEQKDQEIIMADYYESLNKEK